MSRIGKNPITIPAGVEINVNGLEVTVKGPKGELKKTFHHLVKFTVADGVATVERVNDGKEARSLHGLSRTLLANMIEGVTKGFEKKLEIVGVGYRATTAKNKITLSLGYSHPVEYTASNDIEFEMDKEVKNLLIVKGINKELVGEAAAKVRSFRPPEPYKGKGIKYIDEKIIRKAGKTSSK